MDEKRISEQESLAIITEMIARTKQQYISCNILLLWGYLVVIVSILVWVMLAATHQQVWNWLWFAIPLIGSPASMIMARKEHRGAGAITYSDKITSRLWTIFGASEMVLTLLCLGFALLGGINCWIAMLVYSLLAAPCAEIAQGLLIKENSLVAGGIAGLAAGMITLCCVVGGIPLAANWYMPLFILVWVAMMIVPGHLLNDKTSHE